MFKARETLTELFAKAGVAVDGDAPWDVRVRDDRFFPRVLAQKNLGLGESYMAGWWECERIDECVRRMLKAGLDKMVRGDWRFILRLVPAFICNLQTLARSRVVAERHYDLGNDLFTAFLDPYMQYSCAYFQDEDDLDRAQERKMRLTCDKLRLRPGERLLDIGCGWGGLVRFAAERYGCDAVGATISKEQAAFAKELCRGLPVEIVECDYRELQGRFDKIVSVGMFEHVGPKNYPAFMGKVRSLLHDDGVFLLHTIGDNRSTAWCDPWIAKYIFPNGSLPGLSQVAKAAEDVFVLEDLHNLGPHYDRTLMAWLERFRAAWPTLAARYGETFRRMWEYYLSSCAGAFRARDIQLWQLVFTPPGASQPRCRLL